jgi:hypothetical protein
MNKFSFPSFVLVGLVACGCNRNKTDAPAAASAVPSVVVANVVSAAPVASTTPPPSDAGVAAAPAASQVPVQEDYEKKAKAVLSTKAKAVQELTKLEKDIGE